MYVSGHYQPEIRILSCDMVRPSAKHNWNSANFSAPVWRYYWMPKRHARLKLEGLEICPGPEEIVLIPPNTPFAGSCPEPLQQFVVHFLAAPPFDSVKPDLFVIPATQADRSLIALITELEERGGGFDMRLALLNLELCLHALNSIPPDRLVFRRDDPEISMVMKAMRDDPGLNPPLRALATKAGMSVNTFIRRFKAHADCTPRQYLMRAKAEAACIMLWRQKESIDEIAEKLGFCNRNHFAQSFKKLMGRGPGSYRKEAPGRLAS